MATILDIWEAGDRESSEESSARGPVRNHAQYFDCQVELGDEEIDHGDIYADSRVPARGDICPWDSTSVCRKRSIKQDAEQPWLFHITINYSNQPLGGEEPDRTADDNPLNHAADVSWDSEEVREALTKDLDNKPILNTAHQRYETTIEAVRRRRVITIVKNLATWNDSIAVAYEETVNSAGFLGYAAGTVMCKKISARRVFSSNMYYYQVTFIFVWDRLGWKTRVTSVGTQELVATSPAMKWRAITDEAGTPITQPVLLTSAGLRATGNPPTPYIQEFRVHNEANFNALPLGV